jgi:polar amino acid transport system substrate-binding protein
MSFKSRWPLAAATVLLSFAFLQGVAFAASDAPAINYPDPWPLRHLVSPGTLTIATTGKSANITFIDNDGKLAGSFIDLTTKLADDLGLKPNFVDIDWSGVLPGLAANRFDIGCEGADWTPARLGSPDFFMTRPIEVAVNVGMVLKSSGIKTWADVVGKRLGGVKGEEELKDLIAKAGATASKDVLELPGVAEARLALLNGQFDVYGIGLATAQGLMTGPDGDKFAILPGPTNVTPGSICVNKNEGDLAQAIDIMIAKYRVDGTLQAIDKKWSQPDPSAELSLIGY